MVSDMGIGRQDGAYVWHALLNFLTQFGTTQGKWTRSFLRHNYVNNVHTIAISLYGGR